MTSSKNLPISVVETAVLYNLVRQSLSSKSCASYQKSEHSLHHTQFVLIILFVNDSKINEMNKIIIF